MNITFVGRLGRDPELRYMPDGTAVCNINVAEDASYTKDGERIKRVRWFRCSIWGKYGEVVVDHFSKGRGILIERGELLADENGNPRTFTRQDGTIGASFEVRVDKWKFLPCPRNGDDMSDYSDHFDNTESTEESTEDTGTGGISFLGG